MTRLRTSVVSLLALGLVLSGSALASDAPTLGAQGEIYKVVSGPYGTLFPDGSAAPAQNPVLALDIYRPGLAAERLLVPTTEDEFPEDTSSIILDPASQTPFLVWERWKNFIHPELNLVQLSGEGWSAVAELSGNPFRQKSSPTFAITHDSETRLDDAGQPVAHERTIVHLVWLEFSGDGAVSAQYSPVVIEDGSYIGWNPVYRLNGLLDGAAPPQGVSVAPDLARTIAISAGGDDQSVNIAVADPASGRVATITARAIPRDLTDLGDTLAERVTDLGSHLDATDPGCLAGVSDFVRHQMTDLGNRFQTGFVGALTDELSQQILGSEAAGCDAEALAASLRARVAEFGDSFVRSGIAPLTEFARHQMTDLGNRLGTGSIHHQVLLGLVAEHPAPSTGAGRTTILVSRTGADLLVAWEHDGLLSYRETRGGGWSQEFVLRPEGADGWTAAYQALRDRVRDR